MNEFAEPIAVIGMAGRFPGAPDVPQYWANLCAGVESIQFPTDEHLREIGVPESALRDPDYVKAVALAPDIDKFDAGFFGLTPREADLADPQIRLFLESAHGALENAGYDPTRVSDVGVFGSAGVNRYAELHGSGEGGTVRSASGISMGVLNNSDYVATLVSYRFGFRGPSMTVQTACSSSMVATHLAIQALRNGECEIALAGGADVEFPVGHGHWWGPGSPLSRDGHCRPFDREAGGTIFGTGVGVVALKRLDAAVADGDHIRAVIRGTAVNNDGSDKVGFSAPSVSGQKAAILEAMMMAGVRPESISYVEAHATGTPLGDPIEATALIQAYQELSEDDFAPNRCALASVKGNIGHLGHAAGAASLIKAVLSLENEVIPASLNFTEPNPKLGIEQSPFYVNDTLRPWPREAGRPRLAAVNSLGIGGTNVHAILEEAPPRVPDRPPARPRVVIWSAKTPAAESAYRQRLAEHLDRCGDDGFAATVRTLQDGRTRHDVRSAVVASGTGEAAAALRGETTAARPVEGRAVPARGVTFLLPGQGSQHAAMAAGLYGAEPVFTEVFEHCLDLFEEQGLPIRQAWSGATTDDELEDTALAQPLLFSVEYAVAWMWQAWGIRPDRLLGHSIGEFAAAAVAEVFHLADAVRLVAARARAMAAAPAGGMLAVTGPVEQVRAVLPDTVDVAVVNGPQQTVLAGPVDDLEQLVSTLAGRGWTTRRVRTSHAFHSRLMAPAVAEFEAAFEGVELRAPQIPIHSAATGALLSDAEATSPAFWAAQVTGPVHFGPALDALLAEAGGTLLEIGPGQVLTGLVKQHPAHAGGDCRALATLPRRGAPGEAFDSALAAAAALWVAGHELDWQGVEGDLPVCRTAVPGYPYERVRHWVAEPEKPAEEAPAVTGTAPVAEVPLEAPAEPVSPFSVVLWTESGREPQPEPEPELALALLPGDRDRANDLVAALRQAGLQVIPVHAGPHYREAVVGFEVRPGEADDLEQVVTTLAGRGERPKVLVHATGAGAWDAPGTANAAHQAAVSFHSAVTGIQLLTRRFGSAPHLVVLTERSVNVSGGEPLDPVKATLHGLARTLPQEEPGVTGKVIDIGAGVTEDDLVAELTRWRRSEVVALRGERRWVRAEQPFHPQAAAHPPAALRRDGVYLITGGLGGLGLELAKGLARTGLRPRLLLLGRTGVPEGAERDQLLASGDDRTARVCAALDELEALGARYRLVTADVADGRAVRRALDVATARFGELDGVFHLAGVAGDGMLQFRTREQAEQVLAPKVQGTLALAEALADRRAPEFSVLFSSTAALHGMAGSADYSAGNAFLDAIAEAGAFPAKRVLSVNWPAWHSVGMAVSLLARSDPRPLAPRWEITLCPEEYPVLDEHRINEQAVLPGTGSLDLVARAYRAEVAADAAEPIRLRDVAFRRPLVVEDVRRVEITFEPAGTSWRFAVRSYAPAGGDERTHVTGTAEPGAGTVRKVDLPALRERLSDRRRPPTQATARRLFSLGPRWDNVTEIAVEPGNADEKLLTLSLPEAYRGELGDHAVHPTLLDSATAFVRDPERDAFHLPFMYGSVLIHRPLPADLASHIRRTDSPASLLTADVDLIGPDGEVLVEVEGFTMKRVDDLVEIDQPEAAEAPAETVPSGEAAPAEAAPAGLSPAAGVFLLWELLDSRTPRQVAVRPHRDGLPVPLEGPVRALVQPVPGPGTPEPVSAAAVPVQPVEPAAVTSEESIEDRLRALWTNTLGFPEIGLDDDFFDLGGNSLTAVELMGEIRERFSINMSIAALFEFPTLRALAAELTALGAR